MEIKSIFIFTCLLLALKLTYGQTNVDSTSVPQTQTRVAASANPDISVIGDFQGRFRSYGQKNLDAVLNEAEFSFQSVVDPYARADFFYSVGQDAATGKFEGEVEEGFVTTLALPAHLQLKAGRFKETLGRVNPVHSHALPFINTPDAIERFFGEEGLKGDGLSLSWLLPNHTFFQELTAEVTEPAGEGPFFERSSSMDNFLFLLHLKNFWDLTDNASLELGLTGLHGDNNFNQTSNMFAFDITYKWKPLQFNTYQSVTFQNEFFFNHQSSNIEKNTNGFYSLLTVQVAKRWFVSGRFDYSESPYSDVQKQYSGTGSVGWYATEFQKIELEGKYTTNNEALEENGFEKNFTKIYLRWIFVIGSHGAHKY